MTSTIAASAPRPICRKRLNVQYQAAYALTAFFVTALAIASAVSPSISNSNDNHIAHQEIGRHLEDSSGEDDDYTDYSCILLFDIIPESGADQCRFAKSCNRGDGILLSFVFCNSHISYQIWGLILSPLLLLWMVLLFRMLGSTAEDYFSPPLEMFSVKLGLPPRFAGVSLLALGNGAADVSATRNAMTSDTHNGYLMSLGALTGAAMFVGTISAGMIVIVSDGVPCRGALVRDVTALMLTAIVVFTTLYSGTVGPTTISLFTTMYLVFVAIVMVADIYHRNVVMPRMERIAVAADLVQRQRVAAREPQQLARDASNGMADPDTAPPPGPKPRSIFTKTMMSLSNYDYTTTGTSDQRQGWGIESDNAINERPIALHGINGILSGDPHHSPEGLEPSVGNYAILEEGMDHICAEPGGISAYNWRGALQDGWYEFQMELHDKWKELVEDEDVPVWEKGLLICEFPFTVLRLLTVTIPCEGYYTRAMAAASLALSPIWFAFYLWSQYDMNAFWSPPMLYGHLVVCLALGALVLRFAPGGDGSMNLIVATPIALYGFVAAATWIDWIVDHLVALLALLGIVCRIPAPILGMTILAWGNSMSDLTANMTMARKGFSNMAMTACFAEPVFNILIGLSLGFSSLAIETGNPDTSVVLSPSVVTGLIYIVMNTAMLVVVGTCVCHGRIPKEYGYVMFSLYFTYITLSNKTQFTKYAAYFVTCFVKNTPLHGTICTSLYSVLIHA